MFMRMCIRMQENWDHVLKTWPSSQLVSMFVNYIVSPVRRTSPFVILHTWPFS
jgi:hypothetical protein